MTDERYLSWINERLARCAARTGGYGLCREITTEMVEAFPELEQRKGIFRSLAWGPRPHWWCRTPGGTIVDPTGLQHPDGDLFPLDAEAYVNLTEMTEEEAIEAGHVSTSKCMECGEPCYWPRSTLCSEACEDAFSSQF